MNNIIVLIIGMMVVTYIPRLIPFSIVHKGKLPPKLRRFLLFIPYTALGALILPGVFTAVPGTPMAALMGIGLAALLAWFKGGLIFPVIGAITVVYVVLSVF